MLLHKLRRIHWLRTVAVRVATEPIRACQTLVTWVCEWAQPIPLQCPFFASRLSITPHLVACDSEPALWVYGVLSAHHGPIAIPSHRHARGPHSCAQGFPQVPAVPSEMTQRRSCVIWLCDLSLHRGASSVVPSCCSQPCKYVTRLPQQSGEHPHMPQVRTQSDPCSCCPRASMSLAHMSTLSALRYLHRLLRIE